MLACRAVALRRRVRFMGLMIGRWTLGRRLANPFGVERWTFGLFQWHQCHSALRTFAWMIRDDFGMHRARVFPFLVFVPRLLVCRAVVQRRRALVLAMWAIEVNRP